MTDIFDLETDLAEPQTDRDAAKGWPPGSSTFAAPGADPDTEQKPSRKKKPKDGVEHSAPVKLLPAARPPRKLSKRQQAKADKVQLRKERDADAAAKRINGTDGGEEVPKKPWLTVFSGKRARPDEVAETLTDLASMLENAQSEHKSVSALAVQYANYDIGQAYERVVMLLDRGVTLGDAMADQEDAFPPVVRELLAAAKMPADTHRNLRQAAIIIVEADNIKAQVNSALFKPKMMALFLTIFTLAAVQFLLPMTTGMFTGIGAEVPALTVTVMAVGGFLKWGLLAALLLAMIWKLFWTVFQKNELIATAKDTLALKAPLVGDIMRMSVAARFCDVLSACLSVGMSEIESLETAGRACGNRALKKWVDEHVGRQRAGLVSFADVSATEMLPWNFRNRIETTSSLTRRIEILQELGNSFHEKAQTRLSRFAERIGPITEGVVVVAVIIIVMLIIAPILSFVPTMLETIQ
ncbi:type II secretion system F family protein [Arthrobacter koreensis]|uniref:type II secretion system F family protein n=1 Tax=Arthrobacter koreensis TaxID=199136 RepID=UPI0037F46AEF